jgi:hypothetical protein
MNGGRAQECQSQHDATIHHKLVLPTAEIIKPIVGAARQLRQEEMNEKTGVTSNTTGVG